jgi:hypothetical protein
MKFKAVLFLLLYFGLGVGAGIVGLALKDYNTISAQQSAAAATTIAQRAATPTAKSAATIPPPETSDAMPTPTPENQYTAPVADVTPVIDASPTFNVSQIAAATPKVTSATSPVPGLTRSSTTARPNTPTPRVTATVSGTVAANGPKGDSPYTAKEVAGIWDKIPANSMVWYKIGTETAYSLGMTIALDANGRPGLSFSVFSNEQAGDLNVATNPKGRGAPNKILPMHDLIWTGGSANAGIWYVLVKNDNPVPVEYRLTSTLSVNEHKNCHRYPETMSNGVFIIWSVCE